MIFLHLNTVTLMVKLRKMVMQVTKVDGVVDTTGAGATVGPWHLCQ